MKLKLVGGDSAGVVTAYYVRSLRNLVTLFVLFNFIYMVR